MTADKIKGLDSVQIFTEYLRSTGRRCTPERRMVLDCARECDGHFSAEDICQRLARTGSRVATATVYSTLQLLADCGLVRPQRFGDGATRYEFTFSSHLHLVCTACGKIREVRDSRIDESISTRKFRGFVPAYFSLSVYGLCTRCARQSRQNNTNKK